MLHEYHIIGSIQYYLLFHVTTVGLGTHYPQIQGHYCIFIMHLHTITCPGAISDVPRNFFSWGIRPGILLGGKGSTNSIEDRGQTEQGSGGGSSLVRGSTQFANE
jgi:hypothetical protein